MMIITYLKYFVKSPFVPRRKLIGTIFTKRKNDPYFRVVDRNY